MITRRMPDEAEKCALWLLRREEETSVVRFSLIVRIPKLQVDNVPGLTLPMVY